MLIIQYIMVNMLVSVMIQEFENYYFGDDELSLDNFQRTVKEFDSVWAKLAKKYGGEKVKSYTLLNLYANLKKPLGKNQPAVISLLNKFIPTILVTGFLDIDLPYHAKQKQIAKHILKLRIHS